ncbi:MAG: sigma-54-dependent Fis family transcriptional regulator [Calditrichaeota bacterium]|nr:sigma-54-dependent Fis family transcriptional regulator [Calditrichota bacterium]MCB0299644.1 sigma-54-dependent Fis family transcriptional regulator [Calditrichota bacterium]MCB9068633.1 sigma-54-dependent Fis family transcriptional regulator [Calditrichia bacterium]
MKPRILIVDDEADSLDIIADLFSKVGYQTFTAQNGLEALAVIERTEPDILISDLYMPEMDGMKLLDEVSNRYPNVSTIMMTGHKDVNNAVKALQKGARDFILKPFDLEDFLWKVGAIVKMKYNVDEDTFAKFNAPVNKGFANIISRDPRMMALFRKIEKIAPYNLTVMIYGESGTGKELIADAIRQNARPERSQKPFVKVNCGGIPETLLESELFGHEKGAYTNAYYSKPGRFEIADGGSIFLDEIGDISMAMQVKLLRVLSSKEIERLGSTKTKQVDVRVIAATNKNLEAEIEAGRFREDLFFRLNVIPIFLPPLRERRDDIPLLIQHFIKRFCEEFKLPPKQVDDEAMEYLKSYRWPGNVRQLENYVNQAIVLSEGNMLTIKDFPSRVLNETAEDTGFEIDTTRPLDDIMADFEKMVLKKALAENGGNKQQTAKQLQVHRTTLMSRLKKLGL